MTPTHVFAIYFSVGTALGLWMWRSCAENEDLLAEAATVLLIAFFWPGILAWWASLSLERKARRKRGARR